MRTGRIYPDAIVRPLRRHWLVLATAVAVVALPTRRRGAVGRAISAPAANTTTYKDSTGEEPDRPTSRRSSCRTTTRRRSRSGSTFRTRRSTRQDVAVLDIDSDANQATGDPRTSGRTSSSSSSAARSILFKWDGSGYAVSATQSSLSFSCRAGHHSDQRVGSQQHAKARVCVLVVSGMQFDPTTSAIDCANCKRDFAPAHRGSTRMRSRSRSRRWS